MTIMVPVTRLLNRNRNLARFVVIPAVLGFTALCACYAEATDVFDVVSGVIESPLFKGKKTIEKLRLTADLLRSKKLKQSNVALPILDWTDLYLREPDDPLQRLKRWADLTNDDKLSRLRIPRDFLNRILVSEYLVAETDYLDAAPRKKLELLRKLMSQKLVDWSVALSYARLYAGALMTGADRYQKTTPVQALKILKNLKEEGLVGWHYRVPTEAILSAEALAIEKDYRKATPLQRLMRLRELERSGLITALTKKEMEKLPAWRLLTRDASFLRANATARKQRLSQLKNERLILDSTFSELVSIFCPTPLASSPQPGPTPLPRQIQPR